ncbi:PAS domain-containing sensor histidine kinase [Dongia rigui]|uniref:histidine kinase n=1 Tax=Dongia rigui TaxID=940149 RepID=A0ABU5DS76_9PROT|nr:PAS domain-containing sensor histidine kinase [Dongia rigui]MDY0870293.1 PAS domain-containing sensor histidine kinase [Dongia rigui]
MKPEDFHRIVFESADIGIYMTALSGVLMSVNEAFARMMGFESAATLLAETAANPGTLYCDPTRRGRLLKKIRASGHLTNEVSEINRRDGGRVWISESASMHGMGTDNAVLIGTVIDITELVASQQALRTAEERYRGLFENAVDGTFISSLDGKMISANQALARINGYETPDELITAVNNIAVEWYVDPKRRSEFVALAERDGFVRNFESEIYRHKTRERIWIAETARLVRNPNGTPSHFEGTVVDVTERKNFERQLMLARRDAESSNRAKTEFLASMSHELRTPLNAIMGFSELIAMMTRADAQETRVHEYAGDIHASARILFRLIEEILDYSKLESGKATIDEGIVDLAEIMQQCVTMLSARAAKGDIRLHLSLPPDLPRVRGDQRRLLQIVLNLLTNAVKFTPAGGQVSVSAAREPGGGLIFGVADTGIGISARDVERIFEPFVQVNRSAFHQQEGTGLGLAICRSLVELHQGRIEITSQPGQGTHVRVLLPASRVAPADDSSRPVVRQAAADPAGS